jgi:2,4'-dihydroxyacetophenone dioxygenase
VHTFFCPEDNTEDTVALLWMEGAQINFNEDGTLYAINDATSIQYLAETLPAARGTGPVNYIHGGNAGRVKP